MAPPAELGTAAIESVAPSTFPPSVSNGTVGIGALASRPETWHGASKGFDLRPLRLSASSLAHRSIDRSVALPDVDCSPNRWLLDRAPQPNSRTIWRACFR